MQGKSLGKHEGSLKVSNWYTEQGGDPWMREAGMIREREEEVGREERVEEKVLSS